MTDYMSSLWTAWGHSVLQAIPKIIQAVLVLGLVLLVDGRLQQAVERLVGRRGQREVARLLGRLTRIGVMLLGVLIILGIFKQTEIVASFVTSLGIAGLILAFALQDITKNFAAGVLLLIQRPFGLDDHIKVGDFDGIVTDISLRATALRTEDGHEVLIPNANVYSGSITNLTHYPLRRVTVDFPIANTLDPRTALPHLRAALQHALEAKKLIPKEHPPTIAMTAFNKEEYSCRVAFWMQADANETAITSFITLQLHTALEQLKPAAVPASKA